MAEDEKLVEAMAIAIYEYADELEGREAEAAARAALAAAREAGWRLVRDDEDQLQSRERMLTDLGVIRK